MSERRLHGDQPLDQVLLFVLEADVQHAGLSTGRHVARHLEGHGRLARALRSTDQEQLAGAHASADRLVERNEPGRDGLELVDPPRRDALIEAGEHLEGGAWRESPLAGVEGPIRRVSRGSHVGERLFDHRDGRLPPVLSGSLWLRACRGACAQRRRVYDPPPSRQHHPKGLARGIGGVLHALPRVGCSAR